jgi:hypothetical protein
MKLYTLSDALSVKIQERLDLIHNRFPTVRFEEFIVIHKLNHMIMLRFINHDIEEISIEELNDREVRIRALVGPDFLANFMGENYEHFGLKPDKLENTLVHCFNAIPSMTYEYVPSFSEDIKKDVALIEKAFSTSLDIWELQVHDYHVDVLHFCDDCQVNTKSNIDLIPIKKHVSYEGLLKAEIKAIKEHRSLVDVLLDYQK